MEKLYILNSFGADLAIRLKQFDIEIKSASRGLPSPRFAINNNADLAIRLKRGEIMTTEWRPDFNSAHLYFITTTTEKRYHLFKRDVTKRLIVDILDCMRLRKRFKLYSFVVMPNHIHIIIQCQENYPMSAIMRDFKRQVADRLIRQYHAGQNQQMLALLASLVTRKRQKHKVWEDNYLAKAVYSADFLRQKIAYIHNNPCQSHWKLAKQPENYVWSSARYYFTEEPCIIPVDDVGFMFD